MGLSGRHSANINNLVLSAYCLYRDNLISKETFMNNIEGMKMEENKRKDEARVAIFEEESEKVLHTTPALSQIKNLKNKNGDDFKKW